MKTLIKAKNARLRQWTQEVLDLVDLAPIKVVIDEDKENNVLSNLLGDSEAIAFTFVDSEKYGIDKQIRLFAYNLKSVVKNQRGLFGYEQVFKFVLAHELGHYTMILDKVPSFLNNETKADDFATKLLGYRLIHRHGKFE